MEHDEFLDACLRTHQDLLDVEERLHAWLDQMLSMEFGS